MKNDPMLIGVACVLYTACSRPSSDRALRRQMVDTKAATLRESKAKSSDSDLRPKVDLHNSADDVKRKHNSSGTCFVFRDCGRLVRLIFILFLSR